MTIIQAQPLKTYGIFAPVFSVDNEVPVFDGTTGKKIKSGSGVFINDGNIDTNGVIKSNGLGNNYINGKVGMGIEAPAEMLHLKKDGATIRLSSDDTNLEISSKIQFEEGSSEKGVEFFYDGRTTAGAYGLLRFREMGTGEDILSILRNKKVGINTTEPGEEVGINGKVMIGDSDWVKGTSAGSLAVQGMVGIGTNTPHAKLHLIAGTASLAAFKLTPGVKLTTPESGAVEFNGTNIYITQADGTRKTVAFV